MNNILGEKYKGDSPFVANCRKLQSIYRHEIGEEIRPYTDRNGNVHYYGNYIENGDTPKDGCWKNFLTKEAFEHAEERVMNKKKYETIEKDRLFNNLLSSQPMAFNLFCPLRKMLRESRETATRVIKAALPDYPIHEVTGVELEFIPGNYKNLTGDKSAMDAIIRFVDINGKSGFIAVETKYSENLGSNAAYKKDDSGKKKPRPQCAKAIMELQCFTPDAEKKIMDGITPLTQIYRNFLLSEIYGLREGLQSHSIILAPEQHPTTINELNSLIDNLSDDHKGKIKDVTLEDFVNAIIDYCPDAHRVVFKRFYDRYLNFGKLGKY